MFLSLPLIQGMSPLLTSTLSCCRSVVRSPVIAFIEKGGELLVSIIMIQVCSTVWAEPFAHGVLVSRVLIVPSSWAITAPLR